MTGSNAPRPTLAHIARITGVSVSTVSKVLNGRDDVSQDTRAKVDAALRGHHYVRRGTPGSDPAVRTVDLVLTGLDGSWPASVTSGMEAAAYEAGVHVAISRARDGSEPAGGRPGQDWVERVLERGSAGVVLGLVEPTPRQLARLGRAQVPCVVIDPLSDPPRDVISIGVTNWSGAYEATSHLLQRGHRRIGLVTGPPDHLYTRARTAGFRSAMTAAGLDVPPHLIRHGNHDRASGAQQVRALIALPDPPTALFICSDHMAIGGYEALAEAGLRVPDDMSVVGFDDLPEARWVTPALTTVRQPLKEMGGNALRVLVRLMNGEELESPRVELATTLVVRHSTSPRP